MTAAAVTAFWAVSVLLVLTPGADWAYVVAAGSTRRSVGAAVSGLLVGYVLITGLVAGGASAVIARTPAALTTLTLVGAGYLVWLGVRTVRRPPAPAADGSPTGARMAQVVRGAVISGLNPKALLLFLALLPQFVVPDGSWSVAGQMAFLGAVHAANCAAVYTAVGVGSRRLLAASPAAARAVARVSGVAMVLVGLALLAEQLVLQ